MIICLRTYHQLQLIAFTYNIKVLYNHNGQNIRFGSPTFFTFKFNSKNSYGGRNAPHKRSKLTDSSDICEGAIPLTLNHMEIWQTQNRLCGRVKLPQFPPLVCVEPSTDTGKRFKRVFAKTLFQSILDIPFIFPVY